MALYSYVDAPSKGGKTMGPNPEPGEKSQKLEATLVNRFCLPPPRAANRAESGVCSYFLIGSGIDDSDWRRESL